LGPDNFGIYVALTTAAVLAGTFSGFGTHMQLLRDVARAPESRDDSLKTTLGTTAFFGILLLGIYIPLCGFWLAPGIGLWGIAACFGLAELVLQPIFKVSCVERQAREEV